MTIAANAAPRVGGQGQNLFQMLQALQDEFTLSVFCKTEIPGIASTHIKPRSLTTLVSKTRFLRRFRDHYVHWGEKHFDREVARQLEHADLFQGVTGQCLESLQTARRKGIPSVLDVISAHIDEIATEQEREAATFGMRRPVHPVQIQRARAEYQQADYIRVMSRHAAQTFREAGVDGHKVHIVPPPVDVTEFTATQFPQDKFRVSFVGLLEPAKGFRYLVDAFNRVTLKESELHIWGSPGARPVNDYFQKVLAAHPNIKVHRGIEVRAHGFEKVYGTSSVLVHPSMTDGFAYVVSEAMASGIPVIVTSRTGAADLVVEGETGFIVPPRDVAAIAERLAWLHQHPEQVARMGKAARDSMSAHSPESFRKTYSRELKALL